MFSEGQLNAKTSNALLAHVSKDSKLLLNILCNLEKAADVIA